LKWRKIEFRYFGSEALAAMRTECFITQIAITTSTDERYL